ncbi:xanthine dehydrogenase family protein subunit M [soil metagenome]
MKPAPFDYLRPDSVDEALRLLADTPDARVLAGGQSLVPSMNFRHLQPGHLIDINRLAELDYLDDRGGIFAIGAMTRQRTIEYSALMEDRLPLVVAAVRRLGHRQTRNRGTVGGSLCHLDPSAELALMACIHEGEVTLRSVRGQRVLAMKDFALGARETARSDDELLVELRLLPWPQGHGWGFHEFTRRHADWAIASAAVLMTLDERGRIEDISVALGAVEDTPRRLASVESALRGADPVESVFADAVASIARELSPRDDVVAPGWYRVHLAKVLLRRALVDAAQRATPQAARLAF